MAARRVDKLKENRRARRGGQADPSDGGTSDSASAEVLQQVSDLFEKAAAADDPRERDRLKEQALALLREVGDDEVPPPSPAGDSDVLAPVPRSGQTRCWDSNYKVADCSGPHTPPGQDGAMQSGVDWPRPRFQKHGDGTVTDRLTGLIWLENADTFGEVSWDQARILADKLESGSHGLSDGSSSGQWRLPTIRELFSMADYGQAAPIVPIDYPARDTVKPAIYWTSTTLQTDADQAWMMTLGIAPTVFMIKNTANRMWPVRDGDFTIVQKSGQVDTFGFETTGQDGLPQNRKGIEFHGKRFTANANGKGTVTDNLTGLVWLQDANPFGWQSWDNALNRCAELCSGSIPGLEDGSQPGQWRLPNVREIESLVDYGKAGPCLPDGWRPVFKPDPHSPVGSSVQPSSYWTSTTVVGAPSQAMFIIFGIGPIIFENKEHPFFVWPVRDRI